MVIGAIGYRGSTDLDGEVWSESILESTFHNVNLVCLDILHIMEILFGFNGTNTNNFSFGIVNCLLGFSIHIPQPPFLHGGAWLWVSIPRTANCDAVDIG